MYREYSMRGEIKWEIQHKVKPGAVFDMRRHPEYCIFLTSSVNGALTDLLFCMGRISSSSSGLDPECNAYKLIETISLVPNNTRCSTLVC